MTHQINIRKVELDEALTLLELSERTFFDAFADRNTPADMAAYATVNFSIQKIMAELEHTHSSFYFIVFDKVIAGYMKLNMGKAQTEFKDDHSLEVERIYISAQYQGKKLGEKLLNFAIKTAEQGLCDRIWLGVWEKNYAAIRFYDRYGFVQFGTHYFMLGTDKQTDILMKKELK